MLAYQRGDQEALERLYRLYKPSLYSFIYRYSRDEQLSIDVVQDTFVKLQINKLKFDSAKGRVKSYLFQISYRIMIDKLNRRKKWRSLLPFLTPITEDCLSQDDRMTIQEAVAKLPDLQRAVVLLFYFHDISQKDIAHILQIPLGTVKSRMHQAIQILKKELEDTEYDSGSL